MLQSFADKDSERVWRRERVRKLHPDLQRVALRKLVIRWTKAGPEDVSRTDYH